MGSFACLEHVFRRMGDLVNTKLVSLLFSGLPILFNCRPKFYCHHLIRMGVGYEQYPRKISYMLWHRWEFLSKPTVIILIFWICSLLVTLCFIAPIGWLHPCKRMSVSLWWHWGLENSLGDKFRCKFYWFLNWLSYIYYHNEHDVLFLMKTSITYKNLYIYIYIKCYFLWRNSKLMVFQYFPLAAFISLFWLQGIYHWQFLLTPVVNID